ncbi:invasion associated locus B family protein [Rubrimonas cliftonensis]|nr:invasion associated locus B family protein [Rubrimonas cliftonensis]
MNRTAACVAGGLAFALASGALAQDGAAADFETFDDWAFSCSAGACQVYSALVERETGRLNVSLSIVRDPETDGLTAIVNVPLMVALQPGVQIIAEKGAPLRAGYQFCEESGCRAIVQLDAEAETAMRDSGVVAIDLFRYGESSPRRTTMSLDGFDEAIERLLLR